MAGAPMQSETRASATARQVSGRDADSLNMLSVLTKRTYTIAANGRCVLATEQVPLFDDIAEDPDCPGLLDHDLDLYPFKPATDVILKGHAYKGALRDSARVSVQVGRWSKSIHVVGDRRATLSSRGEILFSDPDPFDVMPLRYDRAYGGRDQAAEARYGNPARELEKYVDPTIDLDAASPYIYPRNPAGVGFLIEPTREAVEQLRLPNLEDPEDVLTAERIVCGAAGNWPRMPLPQAFDWVNLGWFPRIGYFGFVPPCDAPSRPIAEVVRGLAPAGILEPGRQEDKFSLRFTNGASLGMQLPHLKGDEECVVVGAHPRQVRFAFRLPGQRPRIWTDGRDGKLNETRPQLHTLVIEPEASRITMLWRGCAPARRPYMPEELETMPFKVEW